MCLFFVLKRSLEKMYWTNLSWVYVLCQSNATFGVKFLFQNLTMDTLLFSIFAFLSLYKLSAVEITLVNKESPSKRAFMWNLITIRVVVLWNMLLGSWIHNGFSADEDKIPWLMPYNLLYSEDVRSKGSSKCTENTLLENHKNWIKIAV